MFVYSKCFINSFFYFGIGLFYKFVVVNYICGYFVIVFIIKDYIIGSNKRGRRE